MKKTFIKRLSLILSILVLISSLPAGFVSAAVVQVGAQVIENYEGTDFYYSNTNDAIGSVIITDYVGSATDLVIPTKIWGHPVSAIGSSAFNGCKNLASVTIPEGVKSLSNYAFANCTALKSVTIPSSLTRIGTSAFSSCTSLTNVYINDVAAWCNIDFYDNGSSNPLYYATKLYINNSLVTSVSIPFGVTSVPERVFSCENITSVTIPTSVTSIGNNAFASCINLKSITIPNSVTEIGREAFYACDSLKNVTIPESVESIGDSAFGNCYRLEAINVSSQNVSFASEDGVLYNKDKTLLICYPVNKLDTSFVVPEGVQTIGKYAFFNNRKLQSIEISEGVTKILNNAFEHTFSLADVTIPKSLTRVDSEAFQDCIGMENVYISDIAAWCGITYGSGQSNPLTRAKDLYIGNELAGDIVIPEGVESIADYAFSGTSITSVTFPKSLKKLGKSAFSSCYNLKNIVIPEGITTIPANAFQYCQFEGVTIPDSVTQIERNAFYSCKIDDVSYCGTAEEWSKINIASGNDVLTKSLRYETKDIVTENGIKYRVSVNNEAEVMAYTGEDTAVVIPAFVDGYPVKVIKAKAFYDNDIIESLVISEGIEHIEEMAFASCSNLKGVSVPEGVVSIGKSAFHNCSLLAEISIPESVNSIGPSAFNGTEYYIDKTNWTDGVLYIDGVLIKAERETEGIYEIKQGTRLIADEAFTGAWIEGVKIPSSITHIGTDVFLNCETLDSVYISDITAWCNTEFGSLKGNPLYFADELYINDELVSDLVIPEDVSFVPAYAFSCTNITSVTIPASVTQMEMYAFYGCKNLKVITTAYMQDDLLGDVFSSCGKISTVIIADGVTSIGDSAFNYSTKLTSVIIPDSVVSIGEDAFAGCSALASIDIPDGVTHLGEGAFSGCSELTSIEIPDGITAIGDYTFSGCTGLTSIDIPEKITTIGYNAFLNCMGITCIDIPDGLVKIGNSAFEGCTNLLWTYIPESVAEIGWNAFEGCTGLWHVLYSGTQQQWNSIRVSYYENEILMTAERHYGATAENIADISKEATCTEAGFDGIRCEICEAEKYSGTTEATGHSFENGICTVCGGYLESAHPYDDDMNESWTIYHENAVSISITFSEDTYTEWYGDYIYIYDSNGNMIGEYNGDTLAGQTITVENNTLVIKMSTNSYNNSYGFRITDIEVTEKQPPVYTDEDTAISVELSGGFADSAVELVAEEITDNQQIADVNIFLSEEVVEKLYDITLRKDGVEIQPDGVVKVRIPAENENSKVYRVETDGTVTDMNAVYEDGYLVFATEHFSLYAVAVEKKAPIYDLGDVNLDGAVNVKDATTIQKWVAGLIELNDEALGVADTNADTSINVKDATTIQKKIAGIA